MMKAAQAGGLESESADHVFPQCGPPLAWELATSDGQRNGLQIVYTSAAESQRDLPDKRDTHQALYPWATDARQRIANKRPPGEDQRQGHLVKWSHAEAE